MICEVMEEIFNSTGGGRRDLPAIAAFLRGGTLEAAAAEALAAVVSRHHCGAAAIFIFNPTLAPESVAPIATAGEAIADLDRLVSRAFQTAAPVRSGAALAIPLASDGPPAGVLVVTQTPSPWDSLHEEAVLLALGIRTHRWMARIAELDRLKSEFVSMVSHELRTPLTTIKGSLDGISRGYAVSPEALNRMVAMARQNADRLGRLIDDLLDMSRFESRGVILRSGAVDLTPLIRELVAAKLPAAEQRGVGLTTAVAEPLQPVLGDEDRIFQALANLADNAIKFCRPGDEVRIEAGSDSCHGFIRVVDTGPGIAPEHQEAIFEKFHQLDSSAHRRAGGVGLGLYITRELINAMGGEILVASELGHGTAFQIRLPLAPAAQATASTSREILVIDDDPTYSHFLEVILEKAGFKVHVAAGASRGERMARELRPGLILLDLMMPEMDGWTLLERFEAEPITRGIPKIILSALRPDPGAHRFRSYRYIEKTGHPKQLIEAVHAIFDAHAIVTTPHGGNEHAG